MVIANRHRDPKSEPREYTPTDFAPFAQTPRRKQGTTLDAQACRDIGDALARQNAEK
jgi:hypothetical protein